jgi:hypothetical protein
MSKHTGALAPSMLSKAGRGPGSAPGPSSSNQTARSNKRSIATVDISIWDACVLDRTRQIFDNFGLAAGQSRIIEILGSYP